MAGAERELPPSVDQAAYRIVQESLTNAARHSGGGRVTIGLAYGDGSGRVIQQVAPSARVPVQGGAGVHRPCAQAVHELLPAAALLRRISATLLRRVASALRRVTTTLRRVAGEEGVTVACS